MTTPTIYTTASLTPGLVVRRFASHDWQTIAAVKHSAATLERARVEFTDGTAAETGWSADWQVR